MKKLFAKIAPGYDRMNRIMSLGLDRFWRCCAIKRGRLSKDAQVLDLACGTGDCTLEILKHFPDAKIIGVDITPEMLELARLKLADRAAVSFEIGDAQRLSQFEDNRFSFAVCAFGFRNFPNKDRALAECYRVLKSDGCLVVLELFRPKSVFLGVMVEVWLAMVSFLFVRGAGGEYRYLRKSVASTVTADEFTEMAEKVGFSVLEKKFMPPAASCIVLSKEAL